LHLDQRIQSNLPPIKADPDKINWVLNNFLTNAIRYAPFRSQILIEVKNVDTRISFSVSDKGQGIEEAYQDRIFERYFQVPGRSDKKGSGIGLAICKEFIEAMGGHVWVKSQIGEGSTFGFDIPIAKDK
jgi:two-component system, NtrC family, sensor histidine kinase KinB